jgi:peptidyl-Asp metalloendopeptidase
MVAPSINNEVLQSEGGAAMKTAISASVIWLVLAALADPVAAQVDTSSRTAVGETRAVFKVIEARKPQDLWPVTKGMRPQNTSEQVALAAPKPNLATARSPEDESSPIIIDVMVAYTKKAASNYSDITRELVDLAIGEANKSFRLSNLGHIKLRLVHAYQTGYLEEGTHFDHVWRFADRGDGYMDEVHGLRDFHRADIAVLVVDDPEGCGLATRVRADADEAFAVVHHGCAAANYTLAHEIGHLIGASHELGYVNGTKWRDIMSSKESCGGCPRVPVWSSPTVLIKGEPTGNAKLDNARVIAEQAARVAAFR